MFTHIIQFMYRVIRSRKFFYAIIVFFILQAGWIAITAQYPMAFDESYHMGIIQLYAHQLLPFSTPQLASAIGYGDLTRYDSYLYHYLMSFPYRLITLFVHQWVAQVIIMRLINVALFTGGLFLFHRLLRRVHIPEAVTNVSLLMLTLIPVVPFLAATINYDNMLFLAVPLVAGFALTCARELTNHARIPATSFILFLATGAAASLVKYAFVPIFVGAFLYLLILWIRTHAKKAALISIIHSFNALKGHTKILLIVALIIGGGLFAERYGGNVIVYHSFQPDCQQLQPLDQCLRYGPWARNYKLAQKVATEDTPLDPSIESYPLVWTTESMRKLYFAIDYNFVESKPLPIPVATAWIVGILGLILSLVFWRSILRVDKRLLLFGTIILFYVGALFLNNLNEYLRYRTLVAVNGRYLILILPLVFAWMGLAYRQLCTSLLQSRARVFLTSFSIIVLLLALQGGGAMTMLVRGTSLLYWQDQGLTDFNGTLQNIVTPLVVGAGND